MVLQYSHQCVLNATLQGTHTHIHYSRKFYEHCGSQTGNAEGSHLWDVMQCR